MMKLALDTRVFYDLTSALDWLGLKAQRDTVAEAYSFMGRG